MTSPEEPLSRLRMTSEAFASLVTHALRDPLNAANGWAHLLAAAEGTRTDGMRQALAGLRSALERQSASIDALGGVLRLAGGESVGRIERIALGAVLAEVTDGLRAAALESGREVVAARADGVRVAGNRQAVVAALQAVGAHALRHGAPGAPLRFEHGGEAEAPVLRVAIDEGDGDGLSIWHAFASVDRLSLELLHAMLSLQAQGARVAPSGEGRVGDVLTIRFGATA